MSTIALVADLHLGAGTHSEWKSASAAFAEFAGDFLPASGVRDLVILGDFLELLTADESPQVDIKAARVACDRLLDAAPEVTDGLERFLRAGGHLTVVVGNHDAHLTDAGVASRLLDRVWSPAKGEPRASIATWFHTIPGVLYAEHGHQHHDINRVSVAVEPFEWTEPRCLQATPAVAIQSARAANRSRIGQFRDGYAAARRIRADARGKGEGESRDMVDAYGAAQGLSPETTRQLAMISGFSTHQAIQRTVRRRLVGSSDSYLTQAAEEIDQLLESRGLGVSVYAFGHTHRARIRSLPSGATYVNPGAWSPVVRQTGNPRRHPFALVDGVSPHAGTFEHPVVTLYEWNGSAAPIAS